jgi:hypothetical protein
MFLLPKLLNSSFLAHSHLHTTSDCLDKFALHKETKDQSIRKRERETDHKQIKRTVCDSGDGIRGLQEMGMCKNTAGLTWISPSTWIREKKKKHNHHHSFHLSSPSWL